MSARILLRKPVKAVLPCHADVYQRPSMYCPWLPAWLHPAYFICGNTEPHFSMSILWKRPTSFPTGSFSNLPVNGPYLIVVCALSAENTFLTIGVRHEHRNVDKVVTRDSLGFLEILA